MSRDSPSTREIERLRDVARLPDENPNPVLSVTPDGAVRYANRAAREAGGLIDADSARLAPALAELLARRGDAGVALECKLDERVWAFSVEVHGDARNLFGIDVTETRLARSALEETRLTLNAVVDALPAIVNVKDRVHRFVLVNPAQAAFYRLEPEQMLGHTIENFADPGYAALTRERDEQVMRTGVALSHYDDDSRDAAGRATTWYSTKVALRNPDGDITAVLTVSQDITERKRVEEQLRESEQRYALAMRGSNEGMWDWNPRTREVLVSPFLADLLDLPPGANSLSGADWDARVHPGDLEGYTARLAAHLDGETPFYGAEYRLMSPRHGVRWVRDRGLAQRDDAGRVLRVAGSIADITEAKRKEIELRQARDDAESATRAKSQFLATMSHELRTPLNAIIGITEMVEEDVIAAGHEELRDPLGRVVRAGRHLLYLIDDVLDLAKIESDRLELFSHTLDVRAVLKEILETTEPLARRNRNRLALRVSDDVTTVRADPTRFRQIVLNLLGNACKFTTDGRISLDATIESREAGDWLRLVVADTGPGIEAEALGALFREFYQADSAGRHRPEGAGLGLAICHRLCRLMGGDITVESTVGEGTAFTVQLPVAGP